jgi:hypothetical protein
MSFSRTHYDCCAYRGRLGESAAHVDYNLDIVKYENCGKCRHEIGLTGAGRNVSHVHGNLIDLESNLMGIDRPTTKCAGYRYIPDEDACHVRGKRQYKTESYPPVDICGTRHENSCQMIDHSACHEPSDRF